MKTRDEIIGRRPVIRLANNRKYIKGDILFVSDYKYVIEKIAKFKVDNLYSISTIDNTGRNVVWLAEFGS